MPLKGTQHILTLVHAVVLLMFELFMSWQIDFCKALKTTSLD
jgi:hypothetical protein